jgi:hypothetical protein
MSCSVISHIITEACALICLQKMKLENSLKECKEKFTEEQSLVIKSINVILMIFIRSMAR